MEIWLGIMIGAVVVLALLFVLGRRASAPGVDPTKLTFDPAVMEEVRALTVSGKKIQAIKLLRDRTPGLALVTAKLIVDRLELAANRPRPSPRPDDSAAAPRRDPDGLPSFDTTPSSSAIPLDVELQARNLKAQGQLISAIKLVREETGIGLKDAKDYVDGL